MVTANESDANVHDVSLVGGNTGLDFANTVYWRGRAQHVELINTYDDLVEWALRVGLMNPRQAERLKRLSLRQPEKAERARCQGHRAAGADVSDFQHPRGPFGSG